MAMRRRGRGARIVGSIEYFLMLSAKLILFSPVFISKRFLRLFFCLIYFVLSNLAFLCVIISPILFNKCKKILFLFLIFLTSAITLFRASIFLALLETFENS